jgi:indole-3-glycerol phosphate synthase
MNILDTIIAHKKIEVALDKRLFTIRDLEETIPFNMPCISLKKRYQQKSTTGIIAEYKRKSPSKGIINDQALVDTVVAQYEQYGAAACSILTDSEFFGGSNEDILKVRGKANLPILRKEFIIDEFQIVQAKSIGADVILLIAACLSVNEVKQLSAFAKSFGLEVLLELHDEAELLHICDSVDFVGINNRNLKNFEVNLEQSVIMKNKISTNFISIAESGIHSVENLQFLKKEGFDGFLIGEKFMKEINPGLAFEAFVKQII